MSYDSWHINELRTQLEHAQRFRELVREMRIAQEQVRTANNAGHKFRAPTMQRDLLEAQVDSELNILPTERTVA